MTLPGAYALIFSPRARRDMSRLDPPVAQAVLDKLRWLAAKRVFPKYWGLS